MTTIRSLQHVIDIIRSKKIDTAEKPSVKNTTLNSRSPSPSSQSRSLAELSTEIHLFLQSLDLSDENTRKRARMFFMRRILDREWGDEIDSRLEEMVSDIHAIIESDPTLSQQFDDLLMELKSNSHH